MEADATRMPAVAGVFYPAEPGELEQTVRRHLAQARPPGGRPKALIVPHAGYVYSGPVAATAYRALEGMEDTIERVVLLGPSHRVFVEGLAVPSARDFATPLGRVPVDTDAVRQALSLAPVHRLDEAHADEHSLEVHLPFLQVLLGSFRLVPFSVGRASAEEVAEVLDALWGGPETLIVISSDLSHYLDYERARRLDGATSEAIERLDPAGLHEESACGRIPIRGLLLSARRRRMSCRAVDLRSSGDTAGGRDRVVGYGAYLLSEPGSPAPGSHPQRQGEDEDRESRDREVLALARRSVEKAGRTGQPLLVDVSRCAPPLREWGAAFVTLRSRGQLRGCIGDLQAYRPLAVSVADNAYRAARADPRFPPLGQEELPEISVEVSLLSRPEPLAVTSEEALLARLRPGVDGLILQDERTRATFLPSVWESLPEPRRFLAGLRRKGGWPDDHWSPTLRVFRYQAEKLEETPDPACGKDPEAGS